MHCGCINHCFVVKAPANAIMRRKQRQRRQEQLTCFSLIAVQPPMHGLQVVAKVSKTDQMGAKLPKYYEWDQEDCHLIYTFIS